MIKMKYLILLLLTTASYLASYGDTIRVYKGTKAGSSFGYRVYLVQDSEQTRIIVAIVDHGILKARLITDTTFTSATVDCQKFKLSQKRQKMYLDVHLRDPFFELLSATSTDKFQNTFKLKLIEYDVFITEINKISLYCNLAKNWQKIDSLNLPFSFSRRFQEQFAKSNEQAIDSIQKLNFPDKETNRKVDSLNRILWKAPYIVSLSLNEKEFKNKIDSISDLFWSELKKDTAVFKYAKNPVPIDHFNGLGVSLLGVGSYNGRIPLGILLFYGIDYNAFCINISGIIAGKFNGASIGAWGTYLDRCNGFFISGFSLGSKKANGLLISGVVGINRKVNGLAVSGLFNLANTVRGVQLSGILNKTVNCNGLQLGLINMTERLHGLQLGLYNYSEESKGFQIGLINKNGSRTLPFINWRF